MVRWQNAWIAGSLAMILSLGACGDDANEMPSQGASSGFDSGSGVIDAGPIVQVILPAPDSGPVQALAPDAGPLVESGVAQPDSGPAVLVDAGAPEGIGAANPCGTDPEPLAAAIKVRELSLYQTVKIPLYKDNAWVLMRNAMVVQGKKSFVRVFVDPQAGFVARMLRGVLSLENGGKTTVLVSERNIAQASSDEAADSTFDFPVAGGLIGSDTKIAITVLEMTCKPAATASGARLPATGAQAMNAESTGKLHVVIVPVTLAGRAPDTSEAQVAKARDALRAYYPVADVEVSVHAPLSYGGTLQANGTGWSELLSQIGKQRTQDAVAGNVYYFGWIAPAASFRDYCRTGCVLGLAPMNPVVSHRDQIGLGVGFVDENTYTTIVHELGHTHGLPHAPCVPRGGTIEGADTKFPYTGAKIGVWGWDDRSAKLMAPTSYVDVMSYCDPVWISDYNYQKIATRSKAVNNAAYIYTPQKQAAQTWHGLILRADGSARWTGVTLHEQPGALSDARVLDAQGDQLSELSVVRVRLSNETESFLYIPEPAANWATLDLGDQKLDLAAIAPALE